VARSRQIAAQDAALAAARDMAVAAAQLPDPVLKIGIDNLPVNGAGRGSLTADSMTMRRIGVSQEVTRADKRALRSGRYRLQADKDLAEKDKIIAAIERDTAIAWLDRYYADAANAVLAAQREQAVNEQQAAQAAYRAGRGSQADVLAAKSSVAQLDDRIDDGARRAHAARIALARWIGDAAALPLSTAPATDTVPLDPATLGTRLARHPDMAVLAKQIGIADADAKLAEADKHPDWTVEVGYQQRGPGYGNMVSFGVSVPLQWDRKNRQDRELAARRAAADRAQAEYDDMLRAHVAETGALLAEWQTSRKRLSRYADTLLPLARERSAAVLAAYRGGKATLQDVLNARRAELDTRLSALQLEAEAARLWAQLNFIIPRGAQ
jgi:outer membrane protein TolC